jgi:alkylated DNA repair dioxygenase AlkB
MQTHVPGLYLISNFITQYEEEELLQDIDILPWKKNRDQSSNRRVQIYGPRYEFDYSIPLDAEIAHLPWYAYPLIEKMLVTCNGNFDFDDYDLGIDACTELFVNEYLPDSDLRFHFDHRYTFKECIFGLSLVSDCTLSFQHSKTGQVLDVKIPARSLYLMTGESRYAFMHGMRSHTLSGERRVSLTFRAVQDDEKRVNLKLNQSE